MESLFKTIICDIDGTVDDGLEFPRLFRELRNRLRLSTDDQAHEWLGQICSTAVAKIGELRNTFGVIGHGAEGYGGRNQLGKLEAEFVAGVTDAIVCYLFQLHKTNPERFLHHRVHYPDNPDFNDWLNGQYPEFKMTLGNEDERAEIVYLASEILFSNDLVTYKELLVQFRETLDVADSSDGDTDAISIAAVDVESTLA